MNSVKVQPLSRYKNEVGKTEQHSLLEKADNSWCHFELLRQNWMLDLGNKCINVERLKNKKTTHFIIRLKVKMTLRCATVIKGTVCCFL